MTVYILPQWRPIQFVPVFPVYRHPRPRIFYPPVNPYYQQQPNAGYSDSYAMPRQPSPRYNADSMPNTNNNGGNASDILSRFDAIDRRYGFDRYNTRPYRDPYEAAVQGYARVRQYQALQDSYIRPFIQAGQAFSDRVFAERDALIERSLHQGDGGFNSPGFYNSDY